MREIAFIKTNKDKWLEFEQAIFGKAKKNPDEMANLYIQLMNDLSYAKTYYAKSRTVIYLNYLASNIYQKIKKNQTNRKQSIGVLLQNRSSANPLRLSQVFDLCFRAILCNCIILELFLPDTIPILLD